MARVLDVEPQIPLFRKLQRGLHMVGLSRIDHVGRIVPDRTTFLPCCRIARDTGAIGVDGVTAAVRPNWIINTRRIRRMKRRSRPAGKNGTTGLCIIVSLKGVTDRCWGHGPDQMTRDGFIERSPVRG